MSADHPRHRVAARWSLLCLALLALAGNAVAGTLGLAWDAVTAATGYRLASGSYTTNLDAGNHTSATVQG